MQHLARLNFSTLLTLRSSLILYCPMLLHKKVLDWLAFCNSTELKHNLLLLCCEKGLFTAFKNTYTIYPFWFPGFHWDTWCSRKRCCKPALHCSALRVRTHCVLQGRRWLCNTCALCSCGGSQSPSEWNGSKGHPSSQMWIKCLSVTAQLRILA